jgi:peptidoglycan/xylan/chitin deacetylase (PgdA/CDA1 family)
VLKLWRSAGFPLGNHTYAHLSLNASSVDEFDQNVAANEPELKSLIGRPGLALVAGQPLARYLFFLSHESVT